MRSFYPQYLRIIPLFLIILLALPSYSVAAGIGEGRPKDTPPATTVPRSNATPVPPSQVPDSVDADSTPPAIVVWYGSHQVFGKLGLPQRWINILGNVKDNESGVRTVTYSINGVSTGQTLSIGPDQRRLLEPGDFNVEIDKDDPNLVEGLNTVQIRATNWENLTSTYDVTVEFYRSNAWHMPYSINWATVTNPQDVLQIVDGRWSWSANGIRTVKMGYDRVLALGDIGWDFFEVVVPITIHQYDPNAWLSPISVGPGYGITLRWRGHTDDPVSGCQPHCGWLPSGGTPWYEMIQNDFDILKITAEPPYGSTGMSVLFTLGRTYIFKTRVEKTTTGGLYRLKVWENNTSEPATWTLERQSQSGNLPSGSIIFVAHHVDATFGNVTVTPLNQESYPLTINKVGNGTVTKSPDQSTFARWSKVTLTSTPDPGWEFSSWSGDVTGTENPTDITITGNNVITATYTAIDYTLAVNKTGSGQVVKDPDQAVYHYGDQVALTAVPDPGWTFSGWSGGLSGTGNPQSILINGDTTVNAAFAQQNYTLSVSTIGSGSVNINPSQPTYHYGDQVTLTAIPGFAWSFNGWSGDISTPQNPVTITIDKNTVVTASFIQYNLLLPNMLRGQENSTVSFYNGLNGLGIHLEWIIWFYHKLLWRLPM